MSIYLKIREGTGKLTGESLCKSCENSVIIEDTVLCQAVHPNIQINKNIFSCNAYGNKSLPRLKQMEAIAWELRTSAGRKIGFHPPKKREGDVPYETPDY